MAKVKLTITESNCRGGYCKKGDEFIVEDLCPPLCHELWNTIYPFVYALQNGTELDYGNARAKEFNAKPMLICNLLMMLTGECYKLSIKV